MRGKAVLTPYDSQQPASRLLSLLPSTAAFRAFSMTRVDTCPTKAAICPPFLADLMGMGEQCLVTY